MGFFHNTNRSVQVLFALLFFGLGLPTPIKAGPPDTEDVSVEAVSTQLAELVRIEVKVNRDSRIDYSYLVDKLTMNSGLSLGVQRLVAAKLDGVSMMVPFAFAKVVHEVTNQTLKKIQKMDIRADAFLAKTINTMVLTAMAAPISKQDEIQTWLDRYAAAEHVGVGDSGTMEFQRSMLEPLFRELGIQAGLPLGAYMDNTSLYLSAEEMFTNLKDVLSWLKVLKTLTPEPSQSEIQSVVDGIFSLTKEQVGKLYKLLSKSQVDYMLKNKSSIESAVDNYVAQAKKNSKEVSADAKGWGGWLGGIIRKVHGLNGADLTRVLNDTDVKESRAAKVAALATLLKNQTFPEMATSKSACAGITARVAD